MVWSLSITLLVLVGCTSQNNNETTTDTDIVTQEQTGAISENIS